MIRSGNADIVIAGASDAPITPIALGAFDIIGAVTSDRNDKPESPPGHMMHRVAALYSPRALEYSFWKIWNTRLLAMRIFSRKFLVLGRHATPII